MAKWSANQIEMRQTAELNPYERNPRVHPDSQVEHLKNSIGEWGFTVPILIDDMNTVIAGHGRLHAATDMGLDEVPCIVATGWTEEQKQAYVIADNKIAQDASWDYDVLAKEVQALAAMNFDLSLTGFNLSDFGADHEFDFSDDTYEPTGDAAEYNQPIIQYVMIFDDESQQEAWHNFLGKLKQEYGGEMTHSARIYEYLRTHGF